nr:hypothetical protein [Tanacetum cinerariifolium]
MLLMQAQENEGIRHRASSVSCSDAFDSDVDEAPTAQTMFMANLSFADLVIDEAGPSYDSDILSEVQYHDHYQDAVCAHHEEHAMHGNVQLNYVVDSHADYTSNSNMISYDQYVKDNAVPVVHSNEQVELYERRARFELTKREQKINEQLRLVISDRNFKEETFKKELHSVKLQLASTINHNKLMVEEVTSMKKDFKQKENKYLEDFLDMESLKEKIDIGYKNPLCLTRAKKVQPALYNGHEIIKDNHVPAIVHNTEDTLEIAEITRRKIYDKMKDPECVTRKVKIAPHDYSKENFLATFTPQKQLTPGQIFWSQDLIKMKSKALKEQTTVSRPIKALTVKNDEIERKNLLIANDNLIAECLSKEVFSVATNFELNVARFTEMHVANTIVEARCLEFEAELFNLRNKSHNDNHDELVNRFSNLEVHHLNLWLKYQNLKDSFGNTPPTPDKDTPNFDSVFVISKMQASLQGKDNIFKKLKKQISHLKETGSDTDRTLKVKALDSQIPQLTAKVTALQAQNDLFRAENDKIKQHYKEFKDRVKPKVLTRGKYAIDVEPIVPPKNNREAHLDYPRHFKESVETICDIVEEAKVELLEYATDTSLQDSYQQDKKHAPALLIRKNQVTFAEQCDKSNSNTPKHVAKLHTLKTNVRMPSFTGVNRCTDASRSQPSSNTKKNRISS